MVFQLIRHGAGHGSYSSSSFLLENNFPASKQTQLTICNMHSRFQMLKLYSRVNTQLKFKFEFEFLTQPRRKLPILPHLIPNQHFHSTRNPNSEFNFREGFERDEFVGSVADPGEREVFRREPDDETALEVQNLLKTYRDSSVSEIELALHQCRLSLTDDLVLDVLKRHRSDWRPAYMFFNWASRCGTESGYSPGCGVHNEILDILGRMRRFHEMTQLFDEMSKRKGLVTERTFGVLLNRYAAAHKTEEAVEIFYKRKGLGFELDLIAFQTLLMSLCRYKHVEMAEFLFHSKKNEFPPDIKSMNIILNGWCVLGSLREAKRFWNDIITSKCKPDKFTYGIFINSLTKAGKLSTAVKLFQAMWEKGCNPDVAICNCIIDALCFKKRIPEALEVLREMNERDCQPDVATYNSLIKHLCKIQRFEKVHELLDDMEQKGCLPNARTYGYLLKSTKKPEEVPGILERMERNGCRMNSDCYNLILKLYMDWGYELKLRSTLDEMERNGMGPDQRTYTIMIHGLYDKGRMDDALSYFKQMTLMGMVPEPRTTLLVNAMNIKLKEREAEPEGKGARNKADSIRPSTRRGKKKRAF